MVKLKIRETVRERFKITGRKKLLHKKAGRKHWASKERKAHRTRGKRLEKLSPGQRRKIRKLLGI